MFEKAFDTVWRDGTTACFCFFLHFPLFRHGKHDGTGKLIFFIRGGIIVERMNFYYTFVFSTLYRGNDTVFLAESVAELHSELNYFYEYCEKWNLKVNTNNSKVMVFSKGRWRLKYTPMHMFNQDSTSIWSLQDFTPLLHSTF
jgi:hypothetical protein